MVLFISIKLKKLFEQGRDYPWERPDQCPECDGCRVWGHGYVPVLFDGFNEPLLIKRHRCPDCRCVMRFRPKGHFKRFQASIKTIQACLSGKLKHGQWNPSISRSRQRHWLLALIRKIKAYLNDTWKKGLLEGFDRLISQGHIPVSRSI